MPVVISGSSDHGASVLCSFFPTSTCDTFSPQFVHSCTKLVKGNNRVYSCGVALPLYSLLYIVGSCGQAIIFHSNRLQCSGPLTVGAGH